MTQGPYRDPLVARSGAFVVRRESFRAVRDIAGDTARLDWLLGGQ